MKQPLLLLALLLTAALLWTLCNTPERSEAQPRAVEIAGLPQPFDPPVSFQPLSQTNLAPFRAAPLFDHQSAQPSGALAPGIYRTEPLTMIVAVPGACDDGFAINRGDARSRMPIQKPGLEFIPLHP